jgi:hypothetical protein
LSSGGPRHIEKFDGFEAIGQGGQIIAVLPGPRMVIVITADDWMRGASEREPEILINQYIVPSIKTTGEKAVVQK